MTATSQIPHGSILAQLRQRQMDEYAAAEQRKKQKAAFTNQMIQLGGMAAGAALAIPTGGLSLAPMMMGASLGGVGGGLLGNAITSTPTSPVQGANALMSVGNLMQGQQGLDIAQQRENRYEATGMANQGLTPGSMMQVGAMEGGTGQWYAPQTPAQPTAPQAAPGQLNYLNQLTQQNALTPEAIQMNTLKNMGMQKYQELALDAQYEKENPLMGTRDINKMPGGTVTDITEKGGKTSKSVGGWINSIEEKTDSGKSIFKSKYQAGDNPMDAKTQRVVQLAIANPDEESSQAIIEWAIAQKHIK